MIAVAVVLLIVVVLVSLAVLSSNPAVFELSIFGASLPATTAGLYLSGAAAMFVLLLAAELLRRGVRRGMRGRRRVKTLRTAASGASAASTAAPAAPTSAAERQALRDEAEELTGDSSDR